MADTRTGTAKRVLYGIVGGLYLLNVLMFVVGYAMTMWLDTSLSTQMHTHAEHPSFIQSPLILIWLLTGIILLMTSILWSRWLARPKRAVIPLASGCVLVALSLLPGFYASPHRFGSYHVIGICCLASLAHDTWTCIRRARKLQALYGQTSPLKQSP